jgi:hypothetical protein
VDGILDDNIGRPAGSVSVGRGGTILVEHDPERSNEQQAQKATRGARFFLSFLFFATRLEYEGSLEGEMRA